MRMEQLQAIEHLLHYVESVNPEDNFWADQMEIVYNALCDEWDERNAEKHVLAWIRKARAEGKVLEDRRGFKRKVLARAKELRAPYEKWKYQDNSEVA